MSQDQSPNWSGYKYSPPGGYTVLPRTQQILKSILKILILSALFSKLDDEINSVMNHDTLSV